LNPNTYIFYEIHIFRWFSGILPGYSGVLVFTLNFRSPTL